MAKTETLAEKISRITNEELRGVATSIDLAFLRDHQDLWELELLTMKRKMEVQISQRRRALEGKKLKFLQRADGRERYLVEVDRFNRWHGRTTHKIRCIEDKRTELRRQESRQALSLLKRAARMIEDQNWLRQFRQLVA